MKLPRYLPALAASTGFVWELAVAGVFLYFGFDANAGVSRVTAASCKYTLFGASLRVLVFLGVVFPIAALALLTRPHDWGSTVAYGAQILIAVFLVLPTIALAGLMLSLVSFCIVGF